MLFEDMKGDRYYKRQYKVLTGHGIKSGLDLLTLRPKKYYNLSAPLEELNPAYIGEYVAVIGKKRSAKLEYKNGIPYVKVTLDCGTQKILLTWKHEGFIYMYNKFGAMPVGKEVCVYGKLGYIQEARLYAMFCPPHIVDPALRKDMTPVWGIKGISDDMIMRLKDLIEPEEPIEEYLPGFCFNLKL